MELVGTLFEVQFEVAQGTDPGSYPFTVTTSLRDPESAQISVDEVQGIITVYPSVLPSEVSPPGSSQPLIFSHQETLEWEELAASFSQSFNLYRGSLGTPGDSTCLMADIIANTTTDSQFPQPGVAWSYLVAGKNVLGEGPFGAAAGGDRPNTAPCN